MVNIFSNHKAALISVSVALSQTVACIMYPASPQILINFIHHEGRNKNIQHYTLYNIQHRLYKNIALLSHTHTHTRLLSFWQPEARFIIQSKLQGWALDRVHNSRRPLHCLVAFCDLVT